MTKKEKEKLEKLVRLANNNPNENEANLAARYACKMLEEHKFDLNITLSAPESPIGGTWQDVCRSTESPPWSRYQGGWDFYAEEILKNMFHQQEQQQQQREKAYRIRRCSKCGSEVRTASLKEPYLCIHCAWLATTGEKP